MTQFLPPNLLALFAPRDPIPYLPPTDKLPWEKEKKGSSYLGVAQFIGDFEDPKDTPPPTRVETKDERKERKRKERLEQVAYKLEQDLAMWDPAADPNTTSDPYKTMFVGRINYDTSESKLKREFEAFGPVRRINLIHDRVTGKPRGYAFIEFEHERDMHSSYKHADGKKIDGRRVLVDIERGRTIKGWRPRRLGGGLGGTRKGGPDVNTKYSGRDEFSGRENRSRSREREPVRERRMDRGGGSPPVDRPPRRRRSRSPRERRRRSRSPRERPARRDDEPDEGVRKRTRRSRSPRVDRKRSRSPRDRKRRRSRSRDRRNRFRSHERQQLEETGVAAMEGDNGDEDGTDYEGLPRGVVVKQEPQDKGQYGGAYPPPEPPAVPNEEMKPEPDVKKKMPPLLPPLPPQQDNGLNGDPEPAAETNFDDSTNEYGTRYEDM